MGATLQPSNGCWEDIARWWRRCLKPTFSLTRLCKINYRGVRVIYERSLPPKVSSSPGLSGFGRSCRARHDPKPRDPNLRNYSRPLTDSADRHETAVETATASGIRGDGDSAISHWVVSLSLMPRYTRKFSLLQHLADTRHQTTRTQNGGKRFW